LKISYKFNNSILTHIMFSGSMKNYIECGTLELYGAICSLYSIFSGCGSFVLEYANYNMNGTATRILYTLNIVVLHDFYILH